MPRTSEPVPRYHYFLDHFPTIEEVLRATRQRMREIWRDERRHKNELKRKCLERKGQV